MAPNRDMTATLPNWVNAAADQLCGHLQGLDAEAHVTEYALDLKKYRLLWFWVSFDREAEACIAIEKGPIACVNVVVQVWEDYEGPHTVYRCKYGVPDPRIGPKLGKASIQLVREKSFPLSGDIVGVHWKGNDLGLGIVQRLNGMSQIRQRLTANIGASEVGMAIQYPWAARTEINADAGHQCWLLETPYPEISGAPPAGPGGGKTSHRTLEWPTLSREIWGCYQTIARCLLATPIPRRQ